MAGLYGSTAGDALDSDDPKVAGHVHDGEHLDGHAQKINLVDHVTGKLRNSNLEDDAVIKRNVLSFLDQGEAIPESEEIGGSTYYYLDLSDIRSEIANNGAFLTTGGVTSNSPGTLATDDFVFGSDSLNDDADSDHDNRFIFDKSKGAFRAGTVQSTQWDDASRGTQSAAFGRNNQAIGGRSTVAGGDANVIAGTGAQAFIGAGTSNAASGSDASIVGGTSNVSGTAATTFIGGGTSNTIGNSATSSFIGAGHSNDVGGTSTRAFIGGGSDNTINGSSRGVIVGGDTNSLGNGSDSSSYSTIVAGTTNTLTGDGSAIVSGTTNTVATANYAFIGAGNTNAVSENYGIIVGGLDNTVSDNYSAIVGGQENIISASDGRNFIGGGGGSGIGNEILAGGNSVIVGGYSNTINNAVGGVKLSSSFIGGGLQNLITGVEVEGMTIVGGRRNSITTATYGFIGGGGGATAPEGNILDSGADYAAIVGGTTNSTNDSYTFVGGGSTNIIDKNDGDASYSIILGGSANEVNAGVTGTRSAAYSVVTGGETNVISDASWSVISGGKDNVIQTGSAASLNYANIRGGLLNRVNTFGINADVGGTSGRGYMYGQFAIGGGYLDVDGFGDPATSGQMQTSILVAGGEVSLFQTYTDLFLNQPTASNELYVPDDTCVMVKLTWAARSSTAGTALASGGTAEILLRRESLAAVKVEENLITTLDTDFSTYVRLSVGSLGVVSVQGYVGTATTQPVRFTVKIEWTEVYLEN